MVVAHVGQLASSWASLIVSRRGHGREGEPGLLGFVSGAAVHGCKLWEGTVSWRAESEACKNHIVDPIPVLTRGSDVVHPGEK